MKLYINIFTHLREKLFIKQLPYYYREKGIIFKINSSEDRIWDFVVIYEDIDIEQTVSYKKGGLLFFSGEPPFVKVYSQKFLNQFDHIITSHSGSDKRNAPFYHKTQQSLPWYFGYDFKEKNINYSFEQLENMIVPLKTKKISFITSNREYLPGHASRLNLLKELQNRYNNEIDFFGKGIKDIDDKAEGLLPYQFSICIENSNISDYWSEKIADAFLGYTIPVYFGCKNMDSYFPNDSYIPLNIKNISSVFAAIDELLSDSDELYQKYLPGVIEARKRLIYKYNLYPSIISLTESIVLSENIEKITLKPSTIFHDVNLENKILKIKRVITRYKDKYL